MTRHQQETPMDPFSIDPAERVEHCRNQVDGLYKPLQSLPEDDLRGQEFIRGQVKAYMESWMRWQESGPEYLDKVARYTALCGDERQQRRETSRKAETAFSLSGAGGAFGAGAGALAIIGVTPWWGGLLGLAVLAGAAAALYRGMVAKRAEDEAQRAPNEETAKLEREVRELVYWLESPVQRVEHRRPDRRPLGL